MVILLDEQFIVMLSTSARTHDVSLPRGHRDMVILLDTAQFTVMLRTPLPGHTMCLYPGDIGTWSSSWTSSLYIQIGL